MARERLELAVRWKNNVVVSRFNAAGDLEDVDDLDNLGLQAMRMDRRWGKRDVSQYTLEIRKHDSGDRPFTWVPGLGGPPSEA